MVLIRIPQFRDGLWYYALDRQHERPFFDYTWRNIGIVLLLMGFFSLIFEFSAVPNPGGPGENGLLAVIGLFIPIGFLCGAFLIVFGKRLIQPSCHCEKCCGKVKNGLCSGHVWFSSDDNGSTGEKIIVYNTRGKEMGYFHKK